MAESVVFHGRLGELYRLSKEGRIKTSLQGSHTRACKFWTAMKVLSGVRNSVVIAHGPSGCAYGVKHSYKLTNSRNSGSPYESVLTTAIDREGVIYGGGDELRGALVEAERKYAPDVIFVATSCAAGIIGENVDAVVEKARAGLRAQVLAVHCEGFAGEYRSGFDLVFRELTRLMDEPTEGSRRELADAVNIVGAKMGPERTEVDTDVKELVRLVEAMGARVNAVIAGNCSLERLKRAPSAAVNCALCLDIGHAIGTAMRDFFGTPLNSTILPYGKAATESWLEGAARRLGMEDSARRVMDEEYGSIAREYEAARAELEGKAAIIEGHDAIRSLAVAHMLDRDFGMRPVIYNFHPWSAEARKTSIDYLLETGLDPEILITKGTLAFGRYEAMRRTEDELLEYLGRLDPRGTVYFGSSLSFPRIPLVDLNAILNRPRFGYRGALKVARCIKTSFDHAARPRSRLMREIVYPAKAACLQGAASLTPKLASAMDDRTLYAGACGGRGRGRGC